MGKSEWREMIESREREEGGAANFRAARNGVTKITFEQTPGGGKGRY